MPSDLSLVRRLHDLDQRIDRLTREVEGLPAHIASIEAKLASHKQELANTQAELEENGRRHRSLEGQVGDYRQRISKLQDQMNVARTNEQFRAFQHEIQFCRDRIDELEEQILEGMELAETLQEDVGRAQGDLRIESARVAEEVRRATARIEADRADRDRELERRRALCRRIGPATLRTYERVREARGAAVVSVDGESCGSCHVRLRPKFLQDLRQIQKGVLTCESCGLIVYIPGSLGDEVPIEDPAGVM